jgi:transposase InsO family protein
LTGELGLQPPPPCKKKRKKQDVTAVEDWPEGRRLQIDATRLTLDDGVAWVYLVEDVKTRQCLAASVASNLSQERAAATLLEGDEQLRLLGLTETRLIQSDAGSDFTSHHFQDICESIGSWVRCRVAQVGGMGILERLNRTFKHEFIFRHEVNTQAELKALIPGFMHWYNERRLYCFRLNRTFTYLSSVGKVSRGTDQDEPDESETEKAYPGSKSSDFARAFA